MTEEKRLWPLLNSNREEKKVFLFFSLLAVWFFVGGLGMGVGIAFFVSPLIGQWTFVVLPLITFFVNGYLLVSYFLFYLPEKARKNREAH
jgi:hypothetical protein